MRPADPEMRRRIEELRKLALDLDHHVAELGQVGMCERREPWFRDSIVMVKPISTDNFNVDLAVAHLGILQVDAVHIVVPLRPRVLHEVQPLRHVLLLFRNQTSGKISTHLVELSVPNAREENSADIGVIQSCELREKCF